MINGPQDRRVHGGPDRDGMPLCDFSSNSKACAPCPEALAAVCYAGCAEKCTKNLSYSNTLMVIWMQP